MKTITIQQIRTLLVQEGLLKEFIVADDWHYLIPAKMSDAIFSSLSYDSRNVTNETLFFCKGAHFKEDFLLSAIANGVDTYISEVPYPVSAHAIIVTDIRKAMAVIAKSFYGNPQEKLMTIAITGTKGKTTSAYFAKAILEASTQHKVAFFSSEETTVDGKNYQEAFLTTPEALDLFAMMASAVEHGMTHLVMEASSQAYKTQRLFGITFDIGVFLNISPDHISPIEHPNFEDYLYCKRELLCNSRQMIINRESDYYELLKETCIENHVPMITFGYQDADYLIHHAKDKLKQFSISADSDVLDLSGTYELALLGDFNHENAAAAILATSCAGATKEDAQTALPTVSVPGRMNLLEKKNGALIFIDYAHNYISLKSISEFAKKLRPKGRLILLTSSAGGKAESRRPDIGRAASEYSDIIYLTTDDPNFEDPQKIVNEIAAAISNPALAIRIELNRKEAIHQAIQEAAENDVVILAGKGTEKYMKISGKVIPYEGDFEIAKSAIQGKTRS